MQRWCQTWFSIISTLDALGLALSLLIQADKIRRSVGDDRQDIALVISKDLSAAQADKARFDEADVL